MKYINNLEGYEFTEDDKFNGFSTNSSNGGADSNTIKEIKEKNQSQDDEIKKLTVEVKEDNNVFTISQGGKELAKIHQLEGESAAVVSGAFEGNNLVLTKDNSQKVTIDASTLALKSSVPTKVSELDNDSHFLTEHQSLDDYAKTVDMPKKVSQLENDSKFVTEDGLTTKLGEKADKVHTHTLSDITDYVAPVLPTKVSQLENDSKFVTEDDVDAAVSEDSVKPIQNKAISSYVNNTFLKKTEATDVVREGKLADYLKTADLSSSVSSAGFLTSASAATTYGTKTDMTNLETKLGAMINANGGNLTFTGNTLNGITTLAAAIQKLADKIDAMP